MDAFQETHCELTVVMPCLNEAETLAVCIEKAWKAIQTHRINAEIIIADNGSSDGSQEIARQNGAKVVPVEEKGYGAALRGGIAEARGKYIIMGDADDSYDFGDIFRFVEKLREGNDLVMGCRLPKGGGTIMPGAMPLKHRILGNPVLSFIGRLFFQSPMTDFHCGLRAFSKEAFIAMDLRTTGMEFASEMVIKATLLEMRLAEIPITLHKDGRSRPPHLRSWRDGWRHLRFMLMFCPKWLFLVPGNTILLLGTALLLALCKGPLHVGAVSLDTNTMLVAAMSILLGFQLVAFYFFAKTFAVTAGFIPKDKWLYRLFSVITLETGLLIGGVCFLVGLALLIGAVLSWGEVGFGDLSYPVSLRKVIPATTLLLIGVQILFSSFFMSILGMRRQ